MYSVHFAREADLKEIMGFVSVAEKEREKYNVVNMFSEEIRSGVINKRYLRSSMFSEGYIVLLARNDEAQIVGLLVITDSLTSALDSKSVLILVQKKTEKHFLANSEWDDVERKANLCKIRCVSPMELPFLEEDIDFEVEAVINLISGRMYFYSFFTQLFMEKSNG